jgi:regulator of replication initiation timing
MSDFVEMCEVKELIVTLRNENAGLRQQIEKMMSDNTVMEAEIGELREELTYSEVRKSELLREMQWLRQRLVASEATTSLPQSKLQVANGLVQRGDVATMCKVLDGFRDGDK